ncbi:MAG: universal stress protein [Lentisphaeraceae bacterium]|nr:universal stress protein [Lentisphaeraceae bacterium]
MPSHTIIVGVDFKDNSEIICQKATIFAEKLNSSITLIHIKEESPYISLLPYEEDACEELTLEKVNSKMECLEKHIVGLGGRIEKSIIETGNTYEVLCNHADRLNAKAIFVGVGQNYILENLIGTTTEKVANLSNKKVIVVNDNTSITVKSVLCAFDFSESSIVALKSSIKFASFFRAKLVVTHIFNSNHDDLIVTDHVSSAVSKIISLEFETMQNRGVLDYEILIRKGSVVAEILRIIEEKNIDLLSIGSSGNSAIKKLLLGSTVAKIIRKSPCSLVISPKRAH